MGRRKIMDLPERIRGEHLGLCVAAHLARTQLVVDPLARYDAKHLIEMVNAVASALARVAPLYVHDAAAGAPRELAPGELAGASVSECGNRLTLKDGRSFGAVTVKRAELRQAIAILKAVGVPALAGPVKPEAPDPHAAARSADPRADLAEVEALLDLPLQPQTLEEMDRRLLHLARSARHGPLANSAMQLMSSLHEARTSARSAERIQPLLVLLRAAVEDAEKPKA
jgi:hypothetical protein